MMAMYCFTLLALTLLLFFATVYLAAYLSLLASIACSGNITMFCGAAASISVDARLTLVLLLLALLAAIVAEYVLCLLYLYASRRYSGWPPVY